MFLWYIFSIMLKYIAAVVLIAGISLYVSVQYKRHAQPPDCHTQKPADAPVAMPNDKNPKGDVCQPEWNPPRWYRLFGWESLQTWGIFLTLIVIADQTNETRKSAIATSEAAQATRVAAKATLRQTRVAKRTMILQFRPKLILRGGGTDKDSVVFWLTNVGGSKAYMNHFRMEFFINDLDSEFNPESSPEGDQIDKDVEFAPGETKTHIVKMESSIWEELHRQADTHKAIPSGIFNWRVICAGSIRYRDDLEIIRMTVFLRHHDVKVGKFVASENPENDYSD